MKHEQYQALLAYLRELGSVVVAFSGGVDSTFLLYAAREALGQKVKAITIASPYIPKWEIQEAVEWAAAAGIEHTVLEAGVAPEIRNNPENRCYLCKKAVFSKILALAAQEGYAQVVDGTNFDDIGDYRPGLKALQELAVKSPLLECRLTKAEIRSLSREFGLPTWDKPPYACLLTRIPYHTELQETDFVKIEQAERYLMELGFRAVRVRCHGDLARIEVARDERSRILQEELLDRISQQLQAYGFRYVALDMAGYKMGSLNAALENLTGA